MRHSPGALSLQVTVLVMDALLPWHVSVVDWACPAFKQRQGQALI